MCTLPKQWSRRRKLATATGLLVLLAAATVFFLARHLTGLVEQALRRNIGTELSLGALETGWNKVILKDLRIRRNGPGPFPERLIIQRLVLTPSFRALFSRKLDIGLLRIEHPMVLIEIGPDGKVIAPLPALATKNKPSPTQPAGPGLVLQIAKIELRDGELIFLDRQGKRRNAPGLSNPKEGYHLLRFPKVQLTAGRLHYPFTSDPLPVSLSLAAPSEGTLSVDGRIALSSLDTSLTLKLRQWDITRFRPYYLKPGDLNVTRGTLDGDASIGIAKHRLNAPGEIRIKGLQLDLAGSRGLFLGLPATAVLGFLKNNKDEISVKFALAGDLASPQFQVRQSLVDQIATGVAGKIGIPIVSDVARGVIFLGGKGVEGIGKLFGK